MKATRQLCIAALLTGLITTPLTRGENADLKELLAGNRVPLNQKLKDLDATWRRVGVTGQSDSGALLMFYARLVGGAASTTYYTKGETVTIAGETYLLAYRPQTKDPDMMALMRGGTPPPPEPFTPDTPLALSLVQLRTAGSLTDIRPFNLEQEIAAQERAQEEVRSAIEGPREKAVNTQSLNNLKQIGLGLAMFADDNNEKLPDLSDPASLKKALAKYISNDKVFMHPRTGEPYSPNPALSGKSRQEFNTAETVVVYEAKPSDDGTRGVLFSDGHVERVTDAKWQDLKRSSHIP